MPQPRSVAPRVPRSLTVVIPVLNEERGLERLIARLVPVLDASGLAWDIVFIDDGSEDGTLAGLHALNARDPRITTVSFSRNFGKEIALAAGLGYAKGDGVVLMDADLQHPPEVIPQFIAKWREGYDIVFGQRDDRAADGALRRLFSRGFYRLFKQMSGTELHRNAGDFRLLDRRAVEALNRFGERTRFTKGLYAWIGFHSIGIPFHVPPRIEGASRFRPQQLFSFALDGVVSFSTVPLRVWSYLGLLVSMGTFGYVIVFLFKTIVYGIDQPGFPTLIMAVMFLGGVQLISLGVLGEYLGRMYEEVKGRPLYLVAEEIGIARPPGQALSLPPTATAAPEPRPPTP